MCLEFYESKPVEVVNNIVERMGYACLQTFKGFCNEILQEPDAKLWLDQLGWGPDQVQELLRQSLPQDFRTMVQAWMRAMEDQSWEDFFAKKPDLDLLGISKWLGLMQWDRSASVCFSQLRVLEQWFGAHDGLLELSFLYADEHFWDFKKDRMSNIAKINTDSSFKQVWDRLHMTEVCSGGNGYLLSWDEKEAMKASRAGRIDTYLSWNDATIWKMGHYASHLEWVLRSCIESDSQQRQESQKWLRFKEAAIDRYVESNDWNKQGVDQIVQEYKSKIRQEYLNQSYAVVSESGVSPLKPRL